jgi:arylsulfatase A-like enzyme
MIVRTLDELNLADRTLLVFTSDNGGESRVTSNAPLRAGKSTLYEGGIRVPLIVRHPGFVKAGTVCKTPVSTIDFHPTFCQIAGTRPDPQQPIDGVSILPLLSNAEARLDRDALYWHYPLLKPHFLGGRSSGAIRQGNWKLIRFFDTSSSELYDLSNDIGETKNLAANQPQKVRQLEGALMTWQHRMGRRIRS